MMSIYTLVPVSISFLVLKIAVFSRIEFQHCAPDLLMVLCVYLCLHKNGREAILYSFYLGLLRDVASCERLGVNASIFAFVGFLLVRFREDFFFEHVFFTTLLAFAFSLQCNFVHACFVFLLSGGDVFDNVFPSALYTAFVTPPAFSLLNTFSTDERSRGLKPRYFR